MKKWMVTCSVDANDIDYVEVIESEGEPGFWACYEIADAHGCPFFSVCELEGVA